jgi:hypothetical protein
MNSELSAFIKNIKRITGKAINSRYFIKALRRLEDIGTVDEEVIKNLIIKSFSLAGNPTNTFEIQEIIHDMELNGLLLPTTYDINAVNQKYLINVNENSKKTQFNKLVENYLKSIK